MIRTLAAALATSTCIVALATPAAAQTRSYDIPAGSLKSAIDAYVRQSGRQVVYRADEVRGARSRGIKGEQSAEAALAALLAGSGFTTRTDGNLIAIVKAGNGSAVADSTSSLGEDAGSGQEIVVTGTNLRGAAPRSSPIQSYSREEIDRAGGRIETFLRTLPQNLATTDASTAGNPGAAGNSVDASRNSNRGTGLNLRGLGPGATLTLFNGHRLAPAGGDGSFIDVSMIPPSALERIDIVTDGASAIYGSDAISGVVNFVLRRNYEGAETGASRAATADGGGHDTIMSQLAGVNWATGNVMVVGQFRDTTPVDAASRHFTDIQPSDFKKELSPDLRSYSGVVSFRQELGESTDALVDFLYGDSHFNQRSDNIDRDDASNNYHDRFSGSTTQLSLSGSLVRQILENWSINVSGTYARIRSSNLEEIPEFDLSDRSQVQATLSNIRFLANGDVLDLPGGFVRASVGAEMRWDGYEVKGDFFPRSLSRQVRSVFGEVLVPLVGTANAVPGLQALELSVAGRFDDYEGVGSAASPRVGVAWQPAPDVTVRGSYSRSFRAPNLYELSNVNRQYYAYETVDPQTGLDSTVYYFAAIGTNKLNPERSRSFTVGIDYRRDRPSGFKGSLTYYNISYRDRIAFPPLSGNLFTVLNEQDALSPYINKTPGSAEISRILAEETVFNLTGAPLAPGQNDVIFDARVTNIARSRQSGVDASFSYDFDSGKIAWSVFGSATYLFENKSQASATTSPANLLDIAFRPVDFRARAGGSVSTSIFSAFLAANYVDGYTNIQATPSEKVSAWLTFDTGISYSFKSSGALNGITLSLSAQNLFDSDPPYLGDAVGSGLTSLHYDAVNASPLGRVVTLALRKRW